MPDISLLQQEYNTVLEEDKTPGIFFTITFSLLLMVIASYIGLYFYNTLLAKQVEEIQKKIADLKVGDVYKNLEQLRATGKTVEMLKTLRESHTSAVRALSELEKSTHPLVLFSSGTFNLTTKEVTANGMADTIHILARQVELYRAHSALEEFSVSQITYADKRSISFSAKLRFKK